MPDLQNFAITPLGAANVNVPRATIEALVTDSQSGAVLADFTGANALNWPGVVSTLTGAQRLVLAEMVANWLIFVKAGLS